MTPEEANRILAEYMGWEHFSRVEDEMGYKAYSPLLSIWCMFGGIDSEPLWSESLDALVPVWEKMRYQYEETMFDVSLRIDLDHKLSSIWMDDYQHSFGDNPPGSDYESGETIQEAAAIATAKAIQELKK